VQQFQLAIAMNRGYTFAGNTGNSIRTILLNGNLNILFFFSMCQFPYCLRYVV